MRTLGTCNRTRKTNIKLNRFLYKIRTKIVFNTFKAILKIIKFGFVQTSMQIIHTIYLFLGDI